jgi:hypothetical protein
MCRASEIVAAPQKYKIFARPPQRCAGLRQGDISSVFATMQSQIGKHRRRMIDNHLPPLFIAPAFV